MAELLEYIVRLRGASAAAAEVRGLRTEFVQLAAAQDAAYGATAAKAEEAAAARRAAAMGVVTKASKVGALAIAAVAFEAVKMSNSYDSAMLKVQTQAGASTAELSRMRSEVLALATSGKSMGQGPTSLAEGLYHLESLGIRGARALHALELASQASAISGANLEETTSALGAAMFVGIKGAGGMDHIMALLNATVGQGNMRMGELVHSLGTGVLSSAKVAGLSIQDVMAALAVFADAGQDASGAAAQFATALHFIYNPTTKAQAALASIGLTSTDLAVDLRKPNGMVTALKDLRDHLSGLSKIDAAQVLGDIFPGGRGRVLQTELVMLDRAQTKWTNINRQATGANWQKAVEAQKKNPATELATAWSKLEGRLVQFGHVVRPILVPVLTAIAGAAGFVLKVFTAVPWLPTILFVGLLVLGFGALARSLGGALAAFVRYGLFLPGVTTETEAATVAITEQAAATTELAAANAEAEATSVGLMGKLGGLAAGLGGIMRYAGPVGAFLYGLGVFNPDSAGLDPNREGALLKAAHDHSLLHGRRDTARVGGRANAGGLKGVDRLDAATIATYEKYPTMLESDLAGGSGPGTLGGVHTTPGIGIPGDQRRLLRAFYERHHIRPPKLLAMGGLARTAGSAIVGDQGPELLDLPAGAQITPLGRGGGGGGGWRGGDIILQVSGREIARVLRREILDAQARG